MNLLPANRNFTLKKVLLMNLSAANPAVMHVKMQEAVLTAAAVPVRCSKQLAPVAEKLAKFPSSQAMIALFIAVTALQTEDKLKIVKILMRPSGRIFLFHYNLFFTAFLKHLNTFITAIALRGNETPRYFYAVFFMQNSCCSTPLCWERIAKLTERTNSAHACIAQNNSIP